jgi:hypothetical protein
MGCTCVCSLLRAAPVALPTNTPLKIKTAAGYVRTDATPDAASVGIGDGNSLPEQFVAYSPADLASTAPVQPGATAILRSRLTGKFCKLVALPSGGQGMVCDQDTASMSSVFTYTYTGGLSYGGRELVSSGTGQALVLSGAANTPVTADAGLTFSAVGGLLQCPVQAASKAATIDHHSGTDPWPYAPAGFLCISQCEPPCSTS